MSEKLLCPECGEPLSARLLIDNKTGELIVDIGCEGDGDDEFELQILTGFTENDIADLEVTGKTFQQEMRVVLKKRIPESF